MSTNRRTLIWYFLILVFMLSILISREFYQFKPKRQLQVQQLIQEKTDFENTQLQIIFESLVKSFNSDFKANTAKIDFAAIFISEEDLKTLGNIVIDSKRKTEERNVALYILSQIGESALSTLIMVAATDLPSGGDISFSAIEVIEALSAQLASIDQLVLEIEELSRKQQDPILKFRIQVVQSNILKRSPALKNSNTTNLF